MSEDNNQEKLSNEKKNIEELIKLRKEQERLLAEQKELDPTRKLKLENLSARYKGYAEMTAADMEKEFKTKSHTQQVHVVSDHNIDPILKAYQEKYGKEKWYQEPESKDNITTLAFPSEKDAAQFFNEQAEGKIPFLVVDGQTNRVMAYSNGDGTLYHSNGLEFKKGDLMKPGETNLDDFERPEVPKSSGHKP